MFLSFLVFFIRYFVIFALSCHSLSSFARGRDVGFLYVVSFFFAFLFFHFTYSASAELCTPIYAGREMEVRVKKKRNGTLRVFCDVVGDRL